MIPLSSSMQWSIPEVNWRDILSVNLLPNLERGTFEALVYDRSTNV